MTTTPFEVADGYYGNMTWQEWNLVKSARSTSALTRSTRSAR
jgi:hypothetical protein